MWRNKESLSAVPSTAPGRVVGTSNAPKAPANHVSPTSRAAHATSWLGPTLKVKGEISANEDLQVDGKVEGPISVGEHSLTVGHGGQVTAGLTAREIIIYGKVEGNIGAGESVEIKKDASVMGELTTQRIVIEDGAYFKGSIEIAKSGNQVDLKVDNSLLAQTASKSA